MPGKPLDDPNKNRDQETADKKHAILAYFRAWPVKKAAAEAVYRSSDTIDIWLKDDPDFSEAFLRARAEWARKQSRRLDPANLLINMYEELKPPKQEADVKVTTIEGQSADDLLQEAKALGLDTSAYEPLLTGISAPGTDPQKSNSRRNLTAASLNSGRWMTSPTSSIPFSPRHSIASSVARTSFETKDGASRQIHSKWMEGWDYANQSGEFEPDHPTQLEYVKECLRAFGIDFLQYDATRGELEGLRDAKKLPEEFAGVTFTKKRMVAMASTLSNR